MTVHRDYLRQPSTLLPWLARTGILLTAFAVRVLTLLNQGLWRDEVDQWLYTMEIPREWIAKITQPGWNGPLFTPMLKGWILLTGDSIFAMRFFSVIFGMLALAMSYALAKRLAGKDAATWTMALSAVSPYMVYYAQEIKMYTWVPLLALTALYAVERAVISPSLRRSWRWWILALASTSLAMYSHILAALLIPVVGLWVLLRWPKYKRGWIAVLLLGALLTLPYTPLLRWQLPLVFSERVTGFHNYTLWQMLDILTQAWTTGITQGLFDSRLLKYGTAAYFGVLALFGVWNLLAGRAWQRVIQLLEWMLLPVLAIWLVSHWGPIFTDRYVIWCTTALYMLVGAGLAFMGRAHKWLPVIALLAILASNGISLHAQATTPIKPRYDQAAAFVEAQRQPDEPLLFQIPYNHRVYQYYAGDLGLWLEAPYTNYPNPDGSYQVSEVWVEGQMLSLLRNYDAVWLVYSEAYEWDRRELVLAWLQKRWTQQVYQPYPYVEVYYFTR